MSRRRRHAWRRPRPSLARRRLYRDTAHKRIAGVCAGLAQYFGTSALMMRFIAITGLIFVPQLTGVAYLLAWLVLRRSQPRASRVLSAYGAGRRPAGRALTDAMSDLVFRWPARRFAEEHRGRTHVYEFEWKSPAFACQVGACHAVELPFVFDSLACVTGPTGLVGEDPPQDLATRMHQLWVGFARDGTLPWAPFDRDARPVYQIAAGQVVHEPRMAAADFLP